MCLGIAAWVLVGASSLPGTCSAGGDSLSLEVVLDSKEYVPGQPIIVTAFARNDGSEPVEDIAPMLPSMEMLAMRLTRRGTDAPLRQHGDVIDVAFGEPGLTLLPGQECCEQFDLLRFFGDRIKPKYWLSTVRMQGVLQSGDYELRCSFRARTGTRRDLAHLTIQSMPVQFRVLPESKAKRALKQLEGLHRESKWEMNGVTPEQAEACRSRLRDLSESPYFLVIFEFATIGASYDQLKELVSILRTLPSAERYGPIFTWTLLDYRGEAEERQRRMAQMGPFTPGSLEERMLDAWRIRVEQKKYYYR
jgi:hypothetical protein